MPEKERIFDVCQKFFNRSEYLADWVEVVNIYVPFSIRKVFRIFKPHCPRCNIKMDMFQIVVRAKNQQGQTCGQKKILPIEEFPGKALFQEALGHLYLGVCENGHESTELTTIGFHTYSLPHFHGLIVSD